MAYFNGFPATYQPVYSQYQQPMIQNQNQQNGVIWVQGEAGAKSYLVAPNNTVQLWDSEEQVIYLKSADASGMPSMKILDYTVRDNTPNFGAKQPLVSDKQTINYATKDELKAVSDQIKAIQAKLSEMEVPEA